MQELLDIILFQSIESTNQISNGFYYDLGKDYLLPLIGVYMVYYIFIKESKRDKLKELNLKNEEQTDKLFFFATLTRNAIRLSELQKGFLKQHLRDMKNDQINFRFLKIVPLEDLNRISEKLNLEEYLLAYTGVYKNDRETSIMEFQNIISSFDFLFNSFSLIKSEMISIQKNDYQRKLEFKDYFKKSNYLLGKILINFERIGGVDNDRICDIYKNYIDKHPKDNYDIQYYYDYFFVPIHDFIVEYLNRIRAFNQDFHDFEVYLKEGILSFNHIKAENEETRKLLSKDFKEICKALIDLNWASRRMLNDIYGS